MLAGTVSLNLLTMLVSRLPVMLRIWKYGSGYGSVILSHVSGSRRRPINYGSGRIRTLPGDFCAHKIEKTLNFFLKILRSKDSEPDPDPPEFMDPDQKLRGINLTMDAPAPQHCAFQILVT
jgi:hypothetical protein